MTEINGVFEETRSVKLKEALLTLTEQTKAAGDQKTAKKLEEVLDKWKDQFLNIGFCGHFSAGKSTMINELLGKPLLPSSPIPTSANLVLIRYGTPKAVVTMTDGEQLQIDVTKVEEWKSYCKNGQEVEKVEIFDDHRLLENGIQFLDTPGIDSTDDAHQAATEAALHLADIIFFITDYNHVQSELNFEFIRTLKEKGKSLILIINQIDKHREEELPFSLFQSRIIGGLKEWGIQLDAILYASMKQPDHPFNQYEELSSIFDFLQQHRYELLLSHSVANTKVLLNEHEQYLLEQVKPELDERQVQIDQLKQELNWEQHAEWFAKYEESRQRPDKWKERVKQEAEKILENAIITPYVTTQLAQEYVESRQKDFKVGLLFSAKKTELEREKRLEALYGDLQQRVETQIEWHLKELLRKSAEALGIQKEEFLVQIMEWNVPFSDKLLQESVQVGVVSREYVYTYTKDLVQKIRRLFTLQIEQWIAKGQEQLEALHEEKYAAYKDKLSVLEKMKGIKAEIRSIKQQVREKGNAQGKAIELLSTNDAERLNISSFLDKNGAGKEASQATQEKQLSTSQEITSEQDSKSLNTQGLESNAAASNVRVSSDSGEISKVPNSQTFHFDSLQNAAKQLKQMSELLREAKRILQPVPSAESLCTDMELKADRLMENRFTVCLFGAFSAGKSSFANALLGDAVLPVSPNPTTAAINQVLPPTAEHPTGTAVIRMKSKRQIEDEIQTALERLHLPHKGEVWRNLQAIRNVDPHQLRSSLKAYYTFLNACHKGWHDAQELLGTEFAVEQQDYSEYVAVEHRACFVGSIQLYHDNAFTAQGIEIIDTPGADSIYSRHTNVTFNYIKHADVIIYVTYYNHAFSRADRQFLDQLGRVKDQFDLDKMFFIVNAADLAESKEELDAVVGHVQDNLLRSGIRFPRIIPVSSLRTLQGKMDEGMTSFMEAFSSFITKDLTQLLVDSASRDVRYGRKWLGELSHDLHKNQGEREKEIENLLNQSELWQRKMKERTYQSYMNEIEQEMREHSFHIKQRLFFSFLEHVQEAFHPSVLSGKNVGGQQLHAALEECMYSVLFQLKEELKATSLRMEGFIQKLLYRSYEEGQKNVLGDGIVLSDMSFSVKELGLPELPNQLESLSEKEVKEVLRHFKSAKQFFEGDGRTLLRAELEQKLHALVDRFLQEAGDTYVSYYQHAWQVEEEKYKQKLAEEIESAVQGKIAVLKGEVKVETLQEIMAEYDLLLQEDKRLISLK